MEKQLILDRLDKTINMLELIKGEEFKFDTYVSQWDRDRGCGTVCCVAGWYPKYIPEVGLEWRFGGIAVRRSDERPTSIQKRLTEWHGLPARLIEVMFGFGQSCSIPVQYTGNAQKYLKFATLTLTFDFEKDLAEVTPQEVADMFKSARALVSDDTLILETN